MIWQRPLLPIKSTWQQVKIEEEAHTHAQTSSSGNHLANPGWQVNSSRPIVQQFRRFSLAEAAATHDGSRRREHTSETSDRRPYLLDDNDTHQVFAELMHRQYLFSHRHTSWTILRYSFLLLLSPRPLYWQELKFLKRNSMKRGNIIVFGPTRGEVYIQSGSFVGGPAFFNINTVCVSITNENERPSKHTCHRYLKVKEDR
jgi:hypothetical protein